MSGSESETDWLDHSAVGSYADRIRRDDNWLTTVEIFDFDSHAVEILDALKNNRVVKRFHLLRTEILLPENQEVHLKLSEVMKCNKSVASLAIFLQGGLLRERLFATMATSGGWSSIQVLALDVLESLSLRENEHLSSFIIKSENLHTLRLEMTGDEAAPIVESLSRTKVQSLTIHFFVNSSVRNGIRQLATALERCTCITELRIIFPCYHQVEFFQILLVESIPKMLGLKKLELQINLRSDQQFFDMVGQCIGGHQGEIEELRVIFFTVAVNSSIVGLAPALRRLKVIQFDGLLTLQRISELSDVAADCDALEEFGYNLSPRNGMPTENFKAICQLLSKFPSLKRVTQDRHPRALDLLEESRFVAFLEKVKTSKTIEQVPQLQCRDAEEEAAIKHHCHNNRMYNQIELIRKKGLLAATVPSSAWPLILKEFSDMPDVRYYLLQQKHGVIIGPT
jgi:hypothetical protein